LIIPFAAVLIFNVNFPCLTKTVREGGKKFLLSTVENIGFIKDIPHSSLFFILFFYFLPTFTKSQLFRTATISGLAEIHGRSEQCTQM
jgi:hypothetical protein